MNGCISCPYAPGNCEEWMLAQQNPSAYCPDAYSEKAQQCGMYDKSADSRRIKSQEFNETDKLGSHSEIF